MDSSTKDMLLVWIGGMIIGLFISIPVSILVLMFAPCLKDLCILFGMVGTCIGAVLMTKIIDWWEGRSWRKYIAKKKGVIGV